MAAAPQLLEREIPANARDLSLIFDIPIDLGHPDELLRRITDWAGSRNGDPPRRVMYANAHVLNQSAENAELRRALESADLVYCDGYGVRLAAKALERPVPHRMTGADWIWSLAALCEQTGESIYLLGSEPGVARGAADRLTATYPRLNVVGTHHGYFEPGSAHEASPLTSTATAMSGDRVRPRSVPRQWRPWYST